MRRRAGLVPRVGVGRDDVVHIDEADLGHLELDHVATAGVAEHRRPELAEVVRVGRAAAADRPDAIRVTALEHRDEPCVAALDRFLDDHVGLVECGLRSASGAFSILTASAGRSGTSFPGTGSPVSGQMASGAPAPSARPTFCSVSRRKAGACCGNSAKCPSAPTATTATVTPAATSLPRRVRVRRARGEFVRWVPTSRLPGFAGGDGGCRGLARGSRPWQRGQMLPGVQRRLNDPGRTRSDRHISSRRRIRSSIGGCVENSFSNVARPLARHARGLVEPQVRGGVVRRAHRDRRRRAILRSAATSPGGYRVSSAPCGVGEVLALPRDGQLDDLADDRREDQQHEPDGEDDRLDAAAAPIAAAAAAERRPTTTTA